MMESPYQIIPVREHYEVKDANGKIILTGDNRREVEDDLVQMLRQNYVGKASIAERKAS